MGVICVPLSTDPKMKLISFFLSSLWSRAARWYIFKPKIQLWGKFWRALERKMLVYILCSFEVYLDHLVYFMVIWLICGYLVCFSPFWYIMFRKFWQPRSGVGTPETPSVFFTGTVKNSNVNCFFLLFKIAVIFSHRKRRMGQLNRCEEHDKAWRRRFQYIFGALDKSAV
jgi:hypothetical protein